MASDDLVERNFAEKASLLDADIVNFRPEFTGLHYGNGTYNGRPRLDDRDSFLVQSMSAHWRRELQDSVTGRRTVVVFLSPPHEVFYDTGQRSFSGTGRSRVTTHHVDAMSTYASLPWRVAPVATDGKEMQLAPQAPDWLARYWRTLEEVSRYQVTISGDELKPMIFARGGTKVVGGILSPAGGGQVLFLPDIDFEPADFVTAQGNWNKKAEQFARTFITEIVSMHEGASEGIVATPAPAWTGLPQYRVPGEGDLIASLGDLQSQIDKIEAEKRSLEESLADLEGLKALLYSKGKPLEAAIIEALRALGFSANGLREGGSEFDVVFEAEEGRLIGEAEGKDAKAIGIDKLRQLAMNIHEDLQRESVSVPAKPVLFGNPFRLTPPAEREAPFTEKTLAAAASSNTALVDTSDLFFAARSVLETGSPGLAKSFRLAILSTTGRVHFPIEADPEDGSPQESRSAV